MLGIASGSFAPQRAQKMGRQGISIANDEIGAPKMDSE